PTNTPLPNMVVNGDFETGAISPWNTSTSSGSAAITTTPVHAGTYSGRITTAATANSSSGIGGGGSCSGGVRIPVSPSTSYTWSGWIFVPTNVAANFASARIRVAWYAAPNCTAGSQLSTNDSSTVSTAGGAWTQVT